LKSLKRIDLDFFWDRITRLAYKLPDHYII